MHSNHHFGWYSSRSRGERHKRGQFGKQRTEPPRPASLARQAWAKLIAKIWKQDPSVCERCGSQMRVIAFIQEPETVQKILQHVGLWRDPAPSTTAARAPPETEICRLDPDGMALDQSLLF